MREILFCFDESLRVEKHRSSAMVPLEVTAKYSEGKSKTKQKSQEFQGRHDANQNIMISP
jgi:hypothetical protein